MEYSFSSRLCTNLLSPNPPTKRIAYVINGLENRARLDVGFYLDGQFSAPNFHDLVLDEGIDLSTDVIEDGP